MEIMVLKFYAFNLISISVIKVKELNWMLQFVILMYFIIIL